MRRSKRLDRNSLLDALYLQWRFLVVRLDLAAQHRRMFDRGIEHALEMRIHAEPGLAGADVGQVVAGRALADVSPGAAGFELQIFFLGHGELGCGRGQFSIARLAIAVRRWTITWRSDSHSETGTSHFCAAAWVSIRRAVAPASRIIVKPRGPNAIRRCPDLRIADHRSPVRASPASSPHPVRPPE